VLHARPDDRTRLPDLVQCGAMRTMTKPPSPNIRLTITVTPEVHAAFTRMAEASSMSLGRCMGEWLSDTVEGVEFVTAQMVRARQAPRAVVKEMRQNLLGLGDEMDQLLSDMRSGKIKLPPGTAAGLGMPAGARTQPAATAAAPRPVIRGGKSSGKTPTNHARGPK
jgi:hypothetical protein